MMVFAQASGTLFEDQDDCRNVPFFEEPFFVPNSMQDIGHTADQTSTPSLNSDGWRPSFEQVHLALYFLITWFVYSRSIQPQAFPETARLQLVD